MNILKSFSQENDYIFCRYLDWMKPNCCSKANQSFPFCSTYIYQGGKANQSFPFCSTYIYQGGHCPSDLYSGILVDVIIIVVINAVRKTMMVMEMKRRVPFMNILNVWDHATCVRCMLLWCSLGMGWYYWASFLSSYISLNIQKLCIMPPFWISKALVWCLSCNSMLILYLDYNLYTVHVYKRTWCYQVQSLFSVTSHHFYSSLFRYLVIFLSDFCFCFVMCKL